MNTYNLVGNNRSPQLVSFLNTIKKDEPICIVYDDDADGLCAGNIVLESLHRFGFANIKTYSKSKENKIFTNEWFKTLYDEKRKTIFCVDFEPISWKYFDVGHLETLPFHFIVIDHHHDMSQAYDSSISMFTRLFMHPLNVSDCKNPSQYCASKLTYDVMSQVIKIPDIEWKILPGMIGDMNIIEWPEYIASVAKQHGVSIDMSHKEGFFASPFGTFANKVGVAGAIEYLQFESCFRALNNAGNIQQAIDTAPQNPQVEQVMRDAMLRFKEIGQYDEQTNTYFVELKTDYGLCSVVSSAISYLNPTVNLLIYQKQLDGVYHLSARSQNSPKHLGEIMKKISAKFEGAHGGGHKPAAGAVCRVEDKDAFIAAFRSELL